MQTIDTQNTWSEKRSWLKWLTFAALVVVFVVAGFWFVTRRSAGFDGGDGRNGGAHQSRCR